MGAGLAGLTSAWALAKEGHEVVVIDREPEVAAASSSANGGIIAASRAYPWSPGEVGRALRQALSRFDPELWLWGMRHLFQRSGGSYRRVLEAKVRLARYSQQAMREIAREIGFDGLRSGVLYLYRDAGALDAAWKRAATMRSLGFEIQLLQTPGITELEPAIDAFVCALGVMDPAPTRIHAVPLPVSPLICLPRSVPLPCPDAAPRHAMID